MTDFTAKQAISLYNAVFTPPVVGSTSQDEVYGDSPAATMARYFDLPFYLSHHVNKVPEFSADHRKIVVSFLRDWAHAIELSYQPEKAEDL